jgi:micrococcal nuclease
MRHIGDGAPFVSGYDTPEIRNSKCAVEKALGQQAKKRMAQLLNIPGLKIYDSGEDDGRYRRPLVWVVLPDGRSVGSVLIGEGLARRWTPEYEANWCPSSEEQTHKRNLL